MIDRNHLAQQPQRQLTAQPEAAVVTNFYTVWLLWDGAGWWLDEEGFTTAASATKRMLKRVAAANLIPRINAEAEHCLGGCVVPDGKKPLRDQMAIVSEAAMIGSVRLEVTRFGFNARVVLPDGGGLKWGREIIAWELESEEAVALAQSVIRGDCPAGVFADYMDENPLPIVSVQSAHRLPTTEGW